MERLIEFLLVLAGLLRYALPFLLFWGLGTLWLRRGRRAWRRAGRALGLECRISGRARRLSGVVSGVDLDLFWSRREGPEARVVNAAGDRSAMVSGARFTARPLRGELDPDAPGAALGRLRADPRAELHPDRIVWKPSGASTMSAGELERAAHHLVAAVREAAGE
jgi:hypothetical protein